MTYLDHAATTPLSPAAAEAMIEAFGLVGNASSLHTAGRRARRVVEECRERIAAALDAHPSEVIFTGGGTEADNLAVKGIYWARRRADARRTRIVLSSVEHHAVSDAAEWLARSQDARIDWVPVDRRGRVDPEVFAEVLGDPATVALASVMWANNEVGTVNPIAELAELAAERAVPLHSDAVQAVGAVPVGFRACGASALTISGHKIGGPAGIGVSLMGRGTDCVPVLHGGGQERELRSGTLDVPAIVGLAVAVEEAVRGRREFAARIAPLRDELVTGVLAAVPDAILNGPPLPPAARGAGERGADSGILDRLPGNAHLSFPGCAGDGLLMLLDELGIACSTGSACTAGVARPSHVLLAMGVDEVTARGSLRFSLGHTSTQADVAAVTGVIGSVVDRARRRRKVSVRN